MRCQRALVPRWESNPRHLNSSQVLKPIDYDTSISIYIITLKEAIQLLTHFFVFITCIKTIMLKIFQVKEMNRIFPEEKYLLYISIIGCLMYVYPHLDPFCFTLFILKLV